MNNDYELRKQVLIERISNMESTLIELFNKIDNKQKSGELIGWSTDFIFDNIDLIALRNFYDSIREDKLTSESLIIHYKQKPIGFYIKMNSNPLVNYLTAAYIKFIKYLEVILENTTHESFFNEIKKYIFDYLSNLKKDVSNIK